MAALTVSGCAGGSLLYPSTSDINRIEQKTLSPAEQKAVIRDLQGAPDASSGRGTAAKPLLQTSTETDS
ncbi:MAG: hypothetical protein AAGJ70_08240 [Pseudomonadota bacterium]